jgi:hypothetical protein
MSNDLLPSPDILADPPEPTAAAQAGKVDLTNGIGSSVLTHYPARGPHSQTNSADHAIPRADASMNHEPPVPKAAADGLAEVMATVRQVESMLRANVALAAEVHFAVERIHDVAMALRMREVDTALCDTLEASIREVGDAIVSNDAAAARTLSAAALLSDLARRVDQMMPQRPAPRAAEMYGLIRTNEISDEIAAPAKTRAPTPLQLSQPVFVYPRSPETTRVPETQVLIETEEFFDEAGTSAMPVSQSAFVHPNSPDRPSFFEVQALVEATDDSGQSAETAAFLVASPSDENKDAAFQASNQEAAGANNPEPPADGQRAESLSEVVASETAAPESTALDDEQMLPPVATALPPTGTNRAVVAEAAAPLESRRAAAADPLAPLYALSEEELIALFS